MDNLPVHTVAGAAEAIEAAGATQLYARKHARNHESSGATQQPRFAFRSKVLPSQEKKLEKAMPEPDARRKREPLTAAEISRFERHASEIFNRLGLEAGPGTQTTPARWLQAMIDMSAGYDGDEKIRAIFPNECPGCPPEHLTHIVEGPIHVQSICEHHVLPIIGEAYVGYIAAHSLIGISKFIRVVRVHARRFTSQERITQHVANDLMQLIKPQGCAVLVKARHLCSIARGVRDVTSATTTMAFRGLYLTDLHERDEFMRLVAQKASNRDRL